MEQLYVRTRGAWRRWLDRNHDTSAGVWLVFYKKHTGRPTLAYDAAVEEALCFGWIDSIIKRLDDERYARKFTPRAARSPWSELNRGRVRRLIGQGRMAPPGLARVAEARESGLWKGSKRPSISFEMPEELGSALARNKKAKAFFDQLAPTYRKQFIGWVSVAKRQETRDRRVRESIALLERGEKLGLR